MAAITPYYAAKGWWGTVKESVLGTHVRPITYFSPFTAETIQGDPGVYVLPTINQSSRADEQYQMLTEFIVRGDITTPLGSYWGMDMLARAVGGTDSLTAGTPNIHAIIPGDSVLPSFTAEKYVIALDTALRYTSCVVEKAALKFNSKTMSEATYTIVAVDETQLAGVYASPGNTGGYTTPTWVNDVPLLIMNTSFSIGGTPNGQIDSIELAIENMVTPVYAALSPLGSNANAPSFYTFGKRSVTGKVTKYFDSWTDYNRAMTGTVSGPIVINSFNQAAGAYGFTLTTTQVSWKKPTQPVKFSEFIKQELPFSILYDPGTGYDMTLSIANAYATAYQ